jgi:hypothetical protein
MHINPFSRPATKLLIIAAVAVSGLAPAAIAEGRGRAQIDYSGTGTYEMIEFGTFARGSGDVDGTPFDGTATFMLRADDGTLPQPGECEGGGANFAVTGRPGQELWGASIGEICGHHVQAPASTVTHAYTGEYSIVESTRRLRDAEGWIEIRLATGNRMSITLFDS